MSAPSLRRYRAERLLERQFEQLRASVAGGVGARLRALGVRLDESDLEACYAQAWQGLYAAVLDGEQVVSPRAWLTLVTYRRALDEHRARIRVKRLPLDSAREHRASAVDDASSVDRDLADQLDDRVRLRHLFEALRARLSAREQQAATLCYLQGLSRAEAATRMGVSEARMQKLMDGRGERAPGVARKVGALVETVGAGRWCEEQGSLMRGFAYGILDPAGQRYRLAELHHAECPACRAYVLSLRGIAAVLPPIPWLLAPLLGSGVAGAAAASGAGAAGAGSASTAPGAGGAQLGSASAASASGATAAGAGIAGAAGGGSWWLAGPLGAKLAAGCLIALSVGAGCVALDGPAHDHGVGAHRRRHASVLARAHAHERVSDATASMAAGEAITDATRANAQTEASDAPVAPSAQAAREFGPERAAGAGAHADVAAGATDAARATAHAASAQSSSTDREPAARAQPSAVAGSGRAASGDASAAEREFAPG